MKKRSKQYRWYKSPCGSAAFCLAVALFFAYAFGFFGFTLSFQLGSVLPHDSSYTGMYEGVAIYEIPLKFRWEQASIDVTVYDFYMDNGKIYSIRCYGAVTNNVSVERLQSLKDTRITAQFSPVRIFHLGYALRSLTVNGQTIIAEQDIRKSVEGSWNVARFVLLVGGGLSGFILLICAVIAVIRPCASAARKRGARSSLSGAANVRRKCCKAVPARRAHRSKAIRASTNSHSITSLQDSEISGRRSSFRKSLYLC